MCSSVENVAVAYGVKTSLLVKWERQLI